MTKGRKTHVSPGTKSDRLAAAEWATDFGELGYTGAFK